MDLLTNPAIFTGWYKEMAPTDYVVIWGENSKIATSKPANRDRMHCFNRKGTQPLKQPTPSEYAYRMPNYHPGTYQNKPLQPILEQTNLKCRATTRFELESQSKTTMRRHMRQPWGESRSHPLLTLCNLPDTTSGKQNSSKWPDHKLLQLTTWQEIQSHWRRRNHLEGTANDPNAA